MPVAASTCRGIKLPCTARGDSTDPRTSAICALVANVEPAGSLAKPWANPPAGTIGGWGRTALMAHRGLPESSAFLSPKRSMNLSVVEKLVAIPAPSKSQPNDQFEALDAPLIERDAQQRNGGAAGEEVTTAGS